MSNENIIENVAATRLDEALATLIEKSVSGIDKASEFLVGEIPDVVYQLLLWHGVISLIQFLVGVILLPLTTLITYKISKKLLLARKQKNHGLVGLSRQTRHHTCSIYRWWVVLLVVRQEPSFPQC
jgi:hypothetical protein